MALYDDQLVFLGFREPKNSDIFPVGNRLDRTDRWLFLSCAEFFGQHSRSCFYQHVGNNCTPVSSLPPSTPICRQLCDICLAWLGDNVFSIRVAATDNLKRLTDHFGTQWARDHILPKVACVPRSTSNRLRTTFFHCVSASTATSA